MQAGEHYLGLSQEQRAHLSDNIASELYCCRKDIIKRVICNFRKANEEWADMVVTDMEKYRCK